MRKQENENDTLIFAIGLRCLPERNGKRKLSSAFLFISVFWLETVFENEDFLSKINKTK